ncbi:MAG: chemotaxis protein CheW [Pseudomonadota bacterium]
MLLDQPTPEALGAPPPRDLSFSGTYVTFVLSDQTFGVEVTHVREILDQQRVNRLPNASHDCTGVIDTRGESIPLIDLASRLGMPPSDPGPDTRVIVFEIEIDGLARPLGVLADRVLNVTIISSADIEPAPRAAVTGGTSEGLRGLTRLDGALVVMLDIAEVFGDRSLPGF